VPVVLEFFEKPSVLIIVVLIVVVFGAKRLPDSARALGRSMRILKAEAKGLKDDGGGAGQPSAAGPQAFLPPVHPAQPTAPTQVVPGTGATPGGGAAGSQPVTAEPLPHQH